MLKMRLEVQFRLIHLLTVDVFWPAKVEFSMSGMSIRSFVTSFIFPSAIALTVQ